MTTPDKLTASAKTAGCAAKLSPGLLESVLKRLPVSTDPNLLVGFATSDDAGVYRLSDDLALVQTVDFFTPIVDDAFNYGEIAATNALSDVYAMGGRPLTALSIVAFPPTAEMEILERILRGGLSKMTEANCTIVGGHSIRDDEPKFGYAVTGLIDPRKIWRNVGARPGDVLFLTKAIGTGVLSTALKQGKVRDEYMEASIVSMSRLNRDAAEALRDLETACTSGETPVHAVTDVTGFSLLGHAKEMAIGSGVSLEFDHARVEYLPGAVDAAKAGFLSGGLKNNQQWLEGCVNFGAEVAEEFRNLSCDPQTSGGFLIAVSPEFAGQLAQAMMARGVLANEIGRATARKSPLLRVD